MKTVTKLFTLSLLLSIPTLSSAHFLKSIMLQIAESSIIDRKTFGQIRIYKSHLSNMLRGELQANQGYGPVSR